MKSRGPLHWAFSRAVEWKRPRFGSHLISPVFGASEMRTQPYLHRRFGLISFTVLGILGGLAAPAVRANPPAAKAFEIQQSKPIAYVDGPSAHPTRHRLDVFRPKGVKDRPVVILVPGG